MLISLGVFFALSLLIIIHECGHFFAARWFNVRVQEFGFGFPPRIFSWTPFDRAQGKEGETKYSFNALPLGGYVRLAGEYEISKESTPELRARSFMEQAVWKRIVIVASGICMNFILGWLILSSIFFFGARQGVVVTEVLPDSPGARAGIAVNDSIVGFTSTDEFIDSIRDFDGETLDLVLERKGETLTLSVVPYAEIIEGRGRIGIGVTEFGFPREPMLKALRDGFMMTLWIAWAVLLTIFELLTGLFGFRGEVIGDVSGPVGIFTTAYSVSSLGFIYVVHLIGVISVNLAVLNLLPIPGLDGGRLLFLVIEKIRGVRIHPKREALVHGIGVVALIMLITIVTFRDLSRLF